MTKDSTMQELWAAVEELRQRIETLEQGGNSPEGVPAQEQLDFVASVTSNRKTFHLRGCKFTKGFLAIEGGFSEFGTHDEAVNAGLVPCKSCGA